MSDFLHEPMLELFIFETSQLLGQLEDIVISSERMQTYSMDAINEIFRIMHTIKGSSAMMLYDNISALAHSIEDIFYFIRENSPSVVKYRELTDLVLKGADFIIGELTKIDEGGSPEADPGLFIKEIEVFLLNLKKDNFSPEESAAICTGEALDKKQKYYIRSVGGAGHEGAKVFEAIIYFEDGCQNESLRAFTALQNLQGLVDVIHCFPAGVLEESSNGLCEEMIRKDGFRILFKTGHPLDIIREILLETVFLKHLEISELKSEHILQKKEQEDIVPTDTVFTSAVSTNETGPGAQSRSLNQSIINVSVSRLDQLMDLVGEMVIAEAMVIHNPDLQDLELGNFQKAASQLNKITGEIQNIVMSIRMVPLSATFYRMNRIVRDMSMKLDKEVSLEIIGEETEVDKNIIEHIADPLVHLVRNALDHGIERSGERLEKGKAPMGTITLEAKSSGSDVLIIVKDDGRGLDREKILAIATKKGLLEKTPEEMSDKEVFNMILTPGFSGKDDVSEFSGRGVGMDVVTQNIEAIGGSVAIDSQLARGTTITLKIPLTLAIIDGMNARVGSSCYTLPTISIKEFFRPEENDIIVEPNGSEMIMVRGQCFSILRLHEVYGIKTAVTELSEGIIIMVEQDDKSFCIFADELLGQQQVVVKALPEYIRKRRKIKGLAGCTLLGDGSISLILDIAGLAG